jgi:hypothetical protein
VLKPVVDLLCKIGSDEQFATVFFDDPEAHLASLDIPEVEKQALLKLDKESVLFMLHASDSEPSKAPEHPQNNESNSHLTIWLGLWTCIAYVLFWMAMGGVKT